MKQLKLAAEQQGSFGLGLIVGLLLGLAIALGVALYVTKVPIPFVEKVPQRSAEQDAAEAAANKDWNPNATLGGGATRAKAAAASASGVIGQAPSPAAAPTLPSAAPASAPDKPQAAPAAPATAAASTAADKPNLVFFVQAGAFSQPEEAEQQRAKLAMQGFNARVYEREANGKRVYRVRIGPFDERSAAEKLQAEVEAAGLVAALVRTQR